MSDDTKPQDVAENPEEQVFDQIEGITIYFNPKGKPPTYWVKDGTKHADPNLARADARTEAKRRKAHDAKTTADLFPAPEPFAPAPSRGRGRR